MNCGNCGAEMKETATDMPFKVGLRTIVIVKALPVLQCANCGEYLLNDPVMARVEDILQGINHEAELEIVPYAA